MANMIWKKLPSGFVDIFRARAVGALAGDQFARNFREGGLQSVVVACYASIVLLVCFIAFPVLSNNYSIAAVWIRLAMLVGLFSVLLVIRVFRGFVLDYYAVVVGGACALLFISILLLLAHPDVVAVGVGFGAMPVAVFCLFLMYGFLRLPVCLMLVIGLIYSAMVCFLSAGEFFGVGGARMVLYLICFNVLGLILSSSVERREFELFRQSILLRESRDLSQLRAETSERAYSEKMRLVAAINHDLRQPMSAALSSLELLGRVVFVDGKSSGSDVLNSAVSALGYLNNTLDHVLTAAKMESDCEPFQVGRVDLFGIIDRVVMAFDADLIKTGMEIRKSYPIDRVEVISDSGVLSRILLNLIGNGLKFNKPSSVRGRGVLVRVRVKGGECVVDVCDTGVGVAEGDLICIWEPYKQVGSTEGGRNLGLGLGLFLVKEFISRLPLHSITMRSRVGMGSRFRITLPGRVVLQNNANFDVFGAAGALDFDCLAGAFVVIFGVESSAQSKEVFDLLHDLDVVYVSVCDITALEGLIESSDRSLDAVLLLEKPVDLLSPSHLFSILARPSPKFEPCVLVEEGLFMQDSGWELHGATRLLSPLQPISIAETIARCVVKNIQIEGDVC